MILFTDSHAFQVLVVPRDKYSINDDGEEGMSLCSNPECDCDRVHDEELTPEQIDTLLTALEKEAVK